MRLVLLEGGISTACVDLPPLPYDLHALVIGGWDCFVLVDPESLQQDMKGRAPTAQCGIYSLYSLVLQ